MKNKVKIYFDSLVAAVLLLALASCGQNASKPSDDPPPVTVVSEMETVLSLALSLPDFHSPGKVVVVHPETFAIGAPDPAHPGDLATLKQDILSQLAVEGFDFAPLLDRLFTENAVPAPLALPSDQAKGYLIDYDRLYDIYFGVEGGGFEKLYADHPEVGGYIRVSVPVLDSTSKIVLIYIGKEKGSVVLAFTYENGELVYLTGAIVGLSQ